MPKVTEEQIHGWILSGLAKYPVLYQTDLYPIYQRMAGLEADLDERPNRVIDACHKFATEDPVCLTQVWTTFEGHRRYRLEHLPGPCRYARLTVGR
jgi:hypothetical protein